MGYTGINNANAFTGGLMQGIGLYNDIRRTKLYEEDIKYQRERQKEQDRLSMRRAEADLRNLDQQHEIAQQEQERRQFMLKAGDLADKLRGISGITDENARQEALDTLALSVNDDPFLVQYLDLNPQMGTGQGRKIVGFHVLNPNEKNPGKHKYTPLVANEALKSVGPYTADNTARWPQQAGISFDIEALDRIAGRQPVTRKVVSAVPEGGKHPVNMYEEEALGLMPGDAWRYQYQQDSATRRAQLRGGSGAGADAWMDYQNRASKFFQTHKGIVPGKFYDMASALEAQEVAENNGIFLVFNKAVDPETGTEGVNLVDHRDLYAAQGVAQPPQGGPGVAPPPQGGPGTPPGRQLNPSEVVEQPLSPGTYTDAESGQSIYWDGAQVAKVLVNGQWVPISSRAAASAPGQPGQPAGPTAGPPTTRRAPYRGLLGGAISTGPGRGGVAHAATMKGGAGAGAPPAASAGKRKRVTDKNRSQAEKEAIQTAGWIIEDPSKKKGQMDRIRRQYPTDVAEAIIEKIEAVLADHARNSGIVSESAKEMIGRGARAVRAGVGRTVGAVNRAYEGSPRASQPF